MFCSGTKDFDLNEKIFSNSARWFFTEAERPRRSGSSSRSYGSLVLPKIKIKWEKWTVFIFIPADCASSTGTLNNTLNF